MWHFDDDHYSEVLERIREDYDLARQKRVEAHPNAHLMLMLTVRGGWWARWLAQVRGARIWKHQSDLFEADYSAFTASYHGLKVRLKPNVQSSEEFD